MKKTLCLAVVVLPSILVRATISIASGGSYTQDFDTLPVTGSTAWTDDTTVPGWFTWKTASPAGPPANISPSTGSSTGGALYSFGANSSTDRALGSLNSTALGNIMYGAAFKNGGSSSISGFTLSYVGEQWRKAENANTLVFQYFIGTPLNIGSSDLGWTTAPALDFAAPIVGNTAPFALDGNAAANRIPLSATVNFSTPVNPNGEFWIRWRDLNDAGNDGGIGIDDVQLEAVPEPVNVALGIFACGLVLVEAGRRVRRNRHVKQA